MKILNPDYSYNTNTFQGEIDTWRLIGTDGTALYAKNAIDTFTNGKGEYIEVERCKVMEMQNNGLIKGLDRVL